jgi:hypothetical protein
MSLKEKIKMSNKEIEVTVVEAPVRNEAELHKILGNTEGISEFTEKLGDRYEVRKAEYF